MIFHFTFYTTSEERRSSDVVRIVGMLDGGLAGDLMLAEQLNQTRIHQMVALGTGGGNGVGDLWGLALTDQVADGGRNRHNFGCQYTAPSALVGKQLLGNNSLQAHAQLHTDLVLLIGGEYLNNTVHSVSCGVCMQGCKHQMAGFRGDQRRFDGLQVTHFTHENHIRILTEDGFQTIGKGAGILPDLTLVDNALVGGVNIFNGIFQGDNMLALGMIDLVQQAGEGSGLAGAGLAGDQHNTLVEFGKAGNIRRKTQLFKSRDMVVENSDSSGNIALLPEQIDTAAGTVGETDGKILLTDVRDDLVMMRQITGVALTVLRCHNIVIQIMQLAVHTDADGDAADNVNIAGTKALGCGNDFAQSKQLAHSGRFSILMYFDQISVELTVR